MIRIDDFASKARLKTAALVSVLLFFAALTGFGQQTINLTAAPTTATLPDGTIAPMWGYFCGTAVTGSTATCAAANPHSVTAPPVWAPLTVYATGNVILDSNGNVQVVTTGGTSGASAPTTWGTTAGATTADGTGTLIWTFRSSLATYLATTATWSPVVITVPTGQGLTINLTNDLSFTTTGSATNKVPTSIVIVGQVGGGLGNSPTSTPSPNHTNAQGCPTWFIASGATPPGVPCTSQQAGASGTPPVQAARVQSMATEVTAGTTSSLTWAALKPGTFLLESGTHPSIQVPMGLLSMLVVTTAPAGTTAGIAYPGLSGSTTASTIPAVQYNAEVPVEFSEIDPVQNKEVDQAVRTAGFSETAVWTRMNTGSITALTLTSPGSGYTTAPTVTITGGGATGGGATASSTIGYGVASVVMTNGGSGYTTAPAVSFGGNGDATATATLAYGTVGGVSISSGGTGYAVGNALTFTGGGFTTAATGTVSSIAAGVAGVTVSAGGAGYTTATVAFSGGGGTGATATATITSGVITAITVTNPGSGYTSAPTVTITGTSTSAATATATLSSTGAIAGVTLSSGGTGYTSSPTIGVVIGTGTVVGTGAGLLPTFSVGTVTVSNAGAYTSAPTVQFAGGGGTGAGATATLSTTSSLILTLTNAGGGYTSAPTVTIAPPGGTGTTATATATVGTGGCGVAHTCYPPAVNYTPFYYLINGVAFNKTAANVSVFPATAGTAANATTGVTSPVLTPITGTVLVRIVNAGLRLHVPSIVGSLTQGLNGAGTAATVGGFTLIAEDGNPLPEVQVAGVTTVPAAPRVQTDVLMVPSKVYDALINAPQPASAGAVVPALPIYDRQLSLSGNSSVRDAGMLAYLSVNNPSTSLGASLPTGGTGALFAAALANPDNYNGLVAGQPFTVSDPSKGVIANDLNVYGVTLLSPPTNGTITCGAMSFVLSETVPGMCANGTFTYTPNTGSTATTDSFTYCANNGINNSTTTPTCPSNLTATVSLGASTLTGNPTAIAQSYTANTATYLKIPSPGLLIGNSDPSDLPITVVTSPAPTVAGGTLVVDAQGGFTVALTSTPTTATTATFNYTVQNSQGRKSSTSGTVTINFPAPSNLQVNVVDAQAYSKCQGLATCIQGLAPIKDYRWIIEEDRTFYVDPNCTANQSITTPGCPSVVGPAAQTTIPTFGVNFHASTMPFVAQGCTGPLSCEWGQTMYDARPACSSPGVPAGCSTTAGQHIPAVCDLGNGACRPDPGDGSTSGGFAWVSPGSVHLDPTKRYYISVLPGDAANPFPSYQGQPRCDAKTGALPPPNATTGVIQCGHTMSGAPIAAACNFLLAGCTPTSNVAFAPVTVLVLPTPLPTGKLSVMVFEDDFPLNGEQDAGGGIDVLALQEPGLGGFNIVLWDTYGGLGDVTGQNTYDMFNQPLSNSLAGTIDPSTGLDACPISTTPLQATGAGGLITGNGSGPATATAMIGMIVTCPKYESDGVTLSPLVGQAIIANLMPEKFSVQAYPGASRIARGEEWLQTNTLDGQHPHDSFIRIGEPGYFQEYGPAGYHVSIGFANPAIINARHDAVCGGAFGAVGPCSNTIEGQVDVQRQSRTPDQRLYPSGSRDALAWTQCWVSLGDPDAEDFMFTKCDANGNFKFTNVPGGNWRLTIGDQWNDQIIDGLSTPATVGGTVTDLNLGKIGVQQWQANLYTTTFIDDNRNGIKDPGEIGIPLLYNMIHYRDGHNANALVTDFNGVANFNETFPLFNWYVVEADDSSTSTRYKTTGIHTVYDAGGPADGSPSCGPGNGARPCGTSTAYSFLANTNEQVPLPADLSVPGAVYCASADCQAEANADFANGTAVPSTGKAGLSTGRIDPPWVTSEGWSGETSQGNWIEFGKAPYAACNPGLSPTAPGNYCAAVTTTLPGATNPTTTYVAENGGIHGIVVYSATRPFDSAQQMIQQPWEPNVPKVTLNLYQEGFAADGVTPTLKLVDTTQSNSWDDWAQGFYPNSTAGSGSGAGQKPYMSCPGQGTATGTNADMFYFTLFDQPNFLDVYNNQHNGATPHTLPYNSQYKCYDAMHIWNQIQPAPIDGKYSFPSFTGIDPATGKVTGTNCTICVNDPDSLDKYRYSTPGTNGLWSPVNGGIPMLPPGKYVVEVVMPPGYEVYKEEDKNLLIGDNFIAPVTQQFGGLGTDIFIIPDQASVASLYGSNADGYNPNNFQNQTTNLSLQEGLSGVPGFPGFQDPNWPCVGEQRVVPDYLSLFPQAKEVAPFAGATRPLCDRKEVTLVNQMSVSAKFFIYTSTHIASKFTGVITDDFTSEFDPFSPQFGEKFSPPNMPISTKDYLGNEISRVYSDHWGIYDGLTFSSWEVNPPNITGYSPTIMVQCMNDAGPILDNNPSSPTYGQMINDPLYNPAYSNFCYEEPYMPGLTTYLDTPVVPTSAFAGAGYNNPDCSYPDATPAIAEVDGDGVGPWVSAAGHSITITALGDQTVPNYGYSGPSATTAPFNAKTITRHYGFGASQGTVTIGGVTAAVTGWTDTQIRVTVPASVPACGVQQQAQYGGPNLSAVPPVSPESCGELLITTANGKQSIDTVTVTIGGKTPAHVTTGTTIQSAIDTAAPGDLIIVNPGTYNELLLMWKPVRLQGVGAASSIISARPVGKLDSWRARVNCLFGLALNGQPYSTAGDLVPLPGGGGFKPLNVYDPSGALSCPATGWKYFGGGPNNPQVDRLPLEGIVGWDTTVNGNLAELLQEPSLMGAYEGAGITVLGKGVRFPAGLDVFGSGQDTAAGSFIAHESQMPVPTIELNNIDADCNTLGPGAQTGYTSNFQCNPSRIDGLSITNSSQGGGGIFVHAWAHNLEIANNRIYNNAGTVSGGINVGQGEAPDAILSGNGGDPVGYNGGVLAGFDQQPWTCLPGAVIYGPNVSPYGYDQVVSPPGTVLDQQLPYCYNLNVSIHNNAITKNSSVGDELFSSTPAGAGGVTLCTGSDYYKFNYNWVCGNLSTGDGGGLAHLGFSVKGDIEHNTILFNQSTNPTIPTNGGGIIVMPTAPDGFNAAGLECGSVTDIDCAPGVGDGTGPDLVVNANLIMGNAAESGSGGGIAFQGVNGTEVTRFPLRPEQWYKVTVTNNIIADNVAGWDGGGISLLDSLKVDIVNNTIVSNVTTASSGVLNNTLGAPLASTVNNTNGCSSNCGTTSAPQAAGLVTIQNSATLTASLPAMINCPPNYTSPGTVINGVAPNGTCRYFSYPRLHNDVFWQNSSYYIGVGALSSQLQQNVVSLYNAFTTTLAASQPTSDATTPNGGGVIITGGTGACVAGTSYWDIGVRGDTGPNNHSGSTINGTPYLLNPRWSVLTPGVTGYARKNLLINPEVKSQYCNGSRIPPEACGAAGGCGWQVPPGISDATVPNPIFNLTPGATVDEGNNWINMKWGPLSLVNPVTNAILGNYALSSTSSAIDYVPVTDQDAVGAPATDFFGNPRPDPGNPNYFDVGAVEFQTGPAVAPVLSSISPASGLSGAAVNVTLTGIGLTGTSNVTVVNSPNISVSNVVVVNDTTVTATFTIAANTALGAHSVQVTTRGLTSNQLTFTVLGPTVTAISPTSGYVGTTVSVTITGTVLTGASAVTIGGSNITCTISGTPTATTVNASCIIASTATAGVKNVSVTTPIGTTPITSSVTFTVLAPNLTGISPTSGVRGTIVPVTISGNDLTGATAVTIGGINITCTIVSPVPTFTTVNASCAIASAATLSAKNVNVTTPNGSPTLAGAFTVTGATVTFAGPAPALTTTTANTTTKTGLVTVSNAAAATGPFKFTATPSIAKVGTAGGTFSVITGGTCSSTTVLNPGNSCTINVQYAPGTSTALATANVTITGSGIAIATLTSPNFTGN